MKRLMLAALIATCAHAAIAQDASKSERHADYAHLENFVGHWTVKGSEDVFLEVCNWYPGNFHIVCNSERKRPDGSTGHGMSILSFASGQGFVYTGIGSKGRYEALHGGTFNDGIFEFLTTTNEDGKSVVSRIRMGPYTQAGFPFVVDTSTDGAAWTTPETTTYIKLK
jgi:hypothetical protein